MRTFLRHVAICLLVIGLLTRRAVAYSVQTHEQLIDLTWKNSIVPLLRARFPGIADAQLAEAHAYAYGGCAIQDIGYYPFGDSFFSDLTHYVRTGDFIANLLRESRTPDELAFSIGALSHYIGDIDGHSIAVNPSVALDFPALEHRYGPSVTYEENPHDHVRTEFAFDINEIAKHRFAPIRYLEHVGLAVPTDLLGRAVYATYGLRINKVLRVERTDIFGYRFGVRHFIPRIAYAETLLHRNRFPPDNPDAEFLKLEADLRQSGVDNNWPPYRRKADFNTHLLAGVILVLPKVGALSMLSIKGPTPQTEEFYVASVNRSTADLRAQLARLLHPPPALAPSSGPPVRQSAIPNRDLDTGAPVRPGGYRLTDQTYAKLLGRITRRPADGVPSGLKQDLLAYYADPDAPIATRKNPEKWAKVQAELAVLKQMRATSGI